MHNPDYGEPAPAPPPPVPVPPNLYRESQMIGEVWSTGLCEFEDDFAGCCMTCWCPCVTFGRISEIVDRGSSSCRRNGALYALIMALTGCQWIYSWFYRTKLRSIYGLPESPCCDCCVHMLCEPCALCQEYRELENRGFEVALGWHLNVERHAGEGAGATRPPAMQGDMTR